MFVVLQDEIRCVLLYAGGARDFRKFRERVTANASPRATMQRTAAVFMRPDATVDQKRHMAIQHAA